MYQNAVQSELFHVKIKKKRTENQCASENMVKILSIGFLIKTIDTIDTINDIDDIDVIDDIG